MMTCAACDKEFTNEEDELLHRIKIHGDFNAVNYLTHEDKEEMKKKVAMRNLLLSGIPVDIIACQVDLDVPTVLKFINEIKTEWGIEG